MIVHFLSPSLMLFHHSFFVVEFLPVFHCFPPFITCFHTVLINFFLPQMNLQKNLKKPEPITGGADATVYVWCLCQTCRMKTKAELLNSQA